MPDLDQPSATPLPGPVARQRRRDLVAATATAVVVLVLGVTFAVVRGDREQDSSASRTAAPVGLQPCGGGDLVAGRPRREEAADTAYLTATLELARGVEPCSVEGYPVVIVLSDGRPAGVGTVADDSLGPPRRLVVLPDRSAKVTLGWAVSNYCGPVVNDAIRLWIAPDLPVEILGFGASSCNPGEGRPPVRVGGFTYVDPTVERGTLTGVVTLNDGPALGTGQFVTAGEVELDGEPDDYRAPIGADGAYEIVLPAGRYRVVVTTHQWYAGRPYSAGSFDVPGGELSELNITLPVR